MPGDPTNGKPLFPETSQTLLRALRADPSDERLWARFERLYEGPIRAWFKQHGLPPGEADDVLHDVYVRLLDGMGRF